MIILNQLHLETDLNNFVDSFSLTIFAGTLIFLFVAKPMIKKNSQDRYARMISRERMNYYLQQVEGLNRAAIVDITDSRGNIKYVNEAFCTTSGYLAHELIGKDYLLLNSGYHSKEFFKEIWDTISSGKIWKGEIRNIAKNGNFYWLFTTIVPIKNETGTLVEFLSLRFDITEKKDKEILYKKFIDNTSDGFWLANMQGQIIEANNAYSKLSGYSYPELLSMKIPDIEVNRSMSETLARIQKVAKDGYDRFETKHRRKNGTIVDVEINATHIPVYDGLFSVFIRDITDRNKLLQLLEKENEASRKLAESKSRFLSTMSHEIRTPISGVIGMTRLLLDSEPNKTTRDGLEKILTTSQGLSGIINEILDYSKIEAGMAQIEIIEFNMSETIESLTALFESIAASKGVDFKILIDKNIPQILLGDGFRIKQVLTNLIGNSLKFTQKGEVTLALNLVEKEGSRVSIKFEVSDTGIGITPDALKDLAQPFVQVDNSISRKFGGTGLGLFISKNILNMMKSSLDIKSEFGLGSRFGFTLDLGYSDKSANIVLSASSIKTNLREIFSQISTQCADKYIIIAEDDPVNQIVISKYLSLANVKQIVVGNGEDCFNLIFASPNKYHCVLMDVHMPKLNGLEATEKIRKINSKIPIIALTAGVTQEEQNACRLSGMNDVLTKPIEPIKLVNLLKKFLVV